MFNLDKAPRGLLELLRLRTDGRLPDGVEQSIRPTVESRDFYGSDLYIPAASTTSVGALASLSNNLTLTAHLGLRSLGGVLTIGAGAATNVQATWFFALPSFPAVPIPLGSMFYAALAAGQTVAFGSGPLPFVLPAGSILTAQVSGAAAGADHNLNVRGLLENFTAIS